jgi:hypothetical protein
VAEKPSAGIAGKEKRLPVEEDIWVVADDQLAGQLRAGIVGSSPYGAG